MTRSGDAAFELPELRVQFGAASDEIAEANESTNDEDTHLDGTRAVEHGRRYDRAVLREGPGHVASASMPGV
jgi:hypothetical protein